MLVVAIDTTARAGSYALLRDEMVLSVRIGDPARAHAARLPAAVVDLLESCQLSLADVDAFAVASGPGSFTGLRIGIAAIQGLAFAVGKPAVGVSALDALAHAAIHRVSPSTVHLGVWMDGQRGEVFAGAYRCRHTTSGAVEVAREDPPIVAAPAEVIERWRAAGMAHGVFVGDGAVLYRGLLEVAATLVDEIIDPVPPLAPAVGHLGLALLADGGPRTPHGITPIYVRRPDAELARDRRRVIP